MSIFFFLSMAGSRREVSALSREGVSRVEADLGISVFEVAAGGKSDPYALLRVLLQEKERVPALPLSSAAWLNPGSQHQK